MIFRREREGKERQTELQLEQSYRMQLWPSWLQSFQFTDTWEFNDRVMCAALSINARRREEFLCLLRNVTADCESSCNAKLRFQVTETVPSFHYSIDVSSLSISFLLMYFSFAIYVLMLESPRNPAMGRQRDATSDRLDQRSQRVPQPGA